MTTTYADVPGFAPWTFAPEPGPTDELMPQWPRLHADWPLVHAYSRLGHVVVSDAQQTRFAIVHPLEGGMKAYDAASLDELRRTVLEDADFLAFVMPASHVRAIVEHVGPIDADSVYYPVPYPMIGGSGAPETYASGDVWVFLDIVGQLWQRA